jgi:pimeloyl-ACP methyl ester carboxylesterase
LSAPKLVVILGFALALAGGSSALAVADDGLPPREPLRQLLLIHGGSFLFDDPHFQARTEAPAIAAGFSPHYVSYPLEDLPGAVIAVREEATRLRERFGRSDVYAYGSSVGGTIAALLAGEGLVSAAVAKAPPSDLVTWEWPQSAYGPDYYERIGASLAARRRLSPLRRPMERPLLVVQGRADRVVPVVMSETFAAKFRQVHLWVVPGGHATEQTHPWVTRRAMRWLGRTAGRITGVMARAHRKTSGGRT